VVGLTNDEVFLAKILPFDLFPCAQRMIIRRAHENPFAPERSDFAAKGFSGVHDQGYVELPLVKSRDVIGYRTLQNLNDEIGMLP
jgi:hypothetical protein